jgi:hypothetical protein
MQNGTALFRQYSMKILTGRIANLLHSRHNRPVYTVNTAKANKPNTVQIIITACGHIQKPPLFSRIIRPPESKKVTLSLHLLNSHSQRNRSDMIITATAKSSPTAATGSSHHPSPTAITA